MTMNEIIAERVPAYAQLMDSYAEYLPDDSWYLALGPLRAMIKRDTTDAAVHRQISDFVEWALEQGDESLATAATLELLEPLLYGHGEPGGRLFEKTLGPKALGYLTRSRLRGGGNESPGTPDLRS